MPKGYEHMRDEFVRQGLPLKEAQAKAARIWNAVHPDDPVGRKAHEPDKRRPPGKRKGR